MDDSFLELVSKCQGHRLDDQRSDFPSPLSLTSPDSNSQRSSRTSSDEDDLFEALWRSQGSRIEEQRCQLPPLSSVTGPGSARHSHRWEPEGEAMSSDDLFELIFASQVRNGVPSLGSYRLLATGRSPLEGDHWKVSQWIFTLVMELYNMLSAHTV